MASIPQMATPFRVQDFKTQFSFRLTQAIDSYNTNPNKGQTDKISERPRNSIVRGMNIACSGVTEEPNGFLTNKEITLIETSFSKELNRMKGFQGTNHKNRLRDHEALIADQVFQELKKHALNRVDTAERQQQNRNHQPQMSPGPAPHVPQASQPLLPTPPAFVQSEPQHPQQSRHQGAGSRKPHHRGQGPRLARTRPAPVPSTPTAPPTRTAPSPTTSQTETKQPPPPSASPSPLKPEATPLDLRLGALPSSRVTIDVPPQTNPPQTPVKEEEDEKTAFYASGNRGGTISTSAPPSSNLTPEIEELFRLREAVEKLRALDPGTFISAATVLEILKDPDHTHIPKVNIDSPAEGKGKSQFVPPSVLNFRLAPIQHLENTSETIEWLNLQHKHTVDVSQKREYRIDDQVILLPTEARTGRTQIEWIRDAILQIPKSTRNTELSVVEQDLIPTMMQVGIHDPQARIAVIYDAYTHKAGGSPEAFTPEGDLIRTTNAQLYLNRAYKEHYYPIHMKADALYTDPLWLFKGLDGQLLKRPIPFTLIGTPTQTFNPAHFPDGEVPVQTDEYYRNDLSKQILSCLYAAHLKGATTLLITPLGCDGHWNDPKQVVRLFIQCLSKFFPGRFERVCFTVPGRDTFPHFADAVKEAGGGSIQQ